MSLVNVAVSGTLSSGFICLCFGKPRFGPHDELQSRIGSLVVNLVVGAAQLFTVIFCLVGWGWSIWWGLIMLRIASEWKYSRKRNNAVYLCGYATERKFSPPCLK
jgi:hypothetical protein